MGTRRYRLPTRRMDHATAYLMILPSFAFLAVFVLVPLYMAVEKSFTDWNFYLESGFVGLRNFRLVLQNELFRASLVNGLKFVALIVPAQLVFSFLFAHVLKGLTGGLGVVVKTAVYVPTVISGVVASTIFSFLLNYRAGLINMLLGAFGVGRIAFLAHPVWAVVSIAVPALWLGFGYNSLVMYAGLINIPQTYYEAAAVDGAGAFTRLVRITLPSMRNVGILLAISLVTGTLQIFDLVFMMTGGGPLNKTLTPILFLYNNFRSLDRTMGYTVAGALIMMLAITAINTVVFTLIRSQKSQDA